LNGKHNSVHIGVPKSKIKRTFSAPVRKEDSKSTEESKKKFQIDVTVFLED
jgi:hypothetical protein